MPRLSLKSLSRYRERTFCLASGSRITRPDQAVDFVNERGFIYFWPIKGIDLPSLWVAVAGNRPVPNEHDDPGHITWGWKDEYLGKRAWYYAKVLRRKATMISLGVAPNFYALSENYGSPEDDYLLAYEEGRLPLAAKMVYEALLHQGAMNTLDLRRAARLASAESDAEFNRALEILQVDFKILPIGVAEAGAWRYAFIYEIVARYYPDLPEQARAIGEAEARKKLLGLYLRSVGAARVKDVNRLFNWPAEITARTVSALVQAAGLVEGVAHPSSPGDWLALPDLVD